MRLPGINISGSLFYAIVFAFVSMIVAVMRSNPQTWYLQKRGARVAFALQPLSSYLCPLSVDAIYGQRDK